MSILFVFLIASLSLRSVSAYSGLFQTFSVGPFNGTIVSDGFWQFCSNPYKTDSQYVNKVLLHHRGYAPSHTTALNVAIMDINGARVMVDTGVYLPPNVQTQLNGGKLLRSMEMAAIPAKSIDAVVLTHCHLDHMAGLVSPNDKAAFPNARIYVHRLDHQFWERPRNDTDYQNFEEIGKYHTSIYISCFSVSL